MAIYKLAALSFIFPHFTTTVLGQNPESTFDSVYCPGLSTTTDLSACNSFAAACTTVDSSQPQNYYECQCATQYFNLIESCSSEFDDCLGTSYFANPFSDLDDVQTSACSVYSEAGYLSNFSAGPVTSTDDSSSSQTGSQSSSPTETPSSTITTPPNQASSSTPGQGLATSSTKSTASGLSPIFDLLAASVAVTILAALV